MSSLVAPGSVDDEDGIDVATPRNPWWVIWIDLGLTGIAAAATFAIANAFGLSVGWSLTAVAASIIVVLFKLSIFLQHKKGVHITAPEYDKICRTADAATAAYRLDHPAVGDRPLRWDCADPTPGAIAIRVLPEVPDPLVKPVHYVQLDDELVRVPGLPSRWSFVRVRKGTLPV